jgi:putative membrane protein
MTVPQAPADEAPAPEVSEQWRRLDPRMIAVHPIRQFVGLLPVLAVVVITGRNGGWQTWVPVAVVVLVLGSGVLRWFTTRYRVTDERVELRSGLLNRQQRSLRRERVRTVDVTAGPAHRLFGLSVVHVGTGSVQAGAHSALSLDAVPTAEAERLRLLLLDRSTRGAAPASAADATSTAPAPGALASNRADAQGEVLAELHWSWLRFAPLTTSGLVAVGAMTAAAFNLANELGLAPADIRAVRQAGDSLSGVSPTAVVALIIAAVLVVAVIGSLLIYIEAWWRYRLTREPDGTLLVRRGLLTTRALSVEEKRLRGAEVHEPLLLRAACGARTSAVTTGLAGRSATGALLPPAPRAQAHRVAAAALRTDPEQATAAPLIRHPRAALTRRLTRALLPAVLLVGLAWLLHEQLPTRWVAAFWPGALVLLPLAVPLGIDRYRNLGHALAERYFVTRAGSLLRRTVAVQRDGLIGWRLHQSLFQRRTGLVTVDAITAAGAGHYPTVDVSFDRAVELVDEVNPGLLPTEPRRGLQT